MIKLTDAKSGLPVYVRGSGIILITRDLGKTILLLNGGMVAVTEEVDDIISKITKQSTLGGLA